MCSLTLIVFYDSLYLGYLLLSVDPAQLVVTMNESVGLPAGT
jgi:hypothetical protein